MDKELKLLIEKYCMGVQPTEEQELEIFDMVGKTGADIKEVSSFMLEVQNGPTREERLAAQEAERIAREKAEKEAKEKAQHEAKAKAERKAKEEAERIAREKAEKKAKEKAEREAKAEAERKAKEEAERKERKKAEQKSKAEEKRKARADMERRNSEMSKASSEWEKMAREEGIARQKALRQYKKHYYGCSYAFERIDEYDDGTFRPTYEVDIYKDGWFYDRVLNHIRKQSITTAKLSVAALNNSTDNMTILGKSRYVLTGKKEDVESQKFMLKDIGEHILVDCATTNNIPFVSGYDKCIVVSDDEDGNKLDFVKGNIKYDALKAAGKVEEIIIDNKWRLDDLESCWGQLLGAAKRVSHGLLVVNVEDIRVFGFCKCFTMLVNGELQESDFNGYVLLNVARRKWSDISGYARDKNEDDYLEMLHDAVHVE